MAVTITIKRLKAANVRLIAPVHKTNATNTNHLSGFAFNDEGYVIACPAGHKPNRVRYKKKTDRFSAAFSQEHCQVVHKADNASCDPAKTNFFCTIVANNIGLRPVGPMSKPRPL
jgi:hypothetical protein